MKVEKLSPTDFEEREVTNISPIPDLYWMSQRIHHLDLHYLTDSDLKEIESLSHGTADTKMRWFGSIDGRYYFFSQNLIYYVYMALVICGAVILLALLFFYDILIVWHKLTATVRCCIHCLSNLKDTQQYYHHFYNASAQVQHTLGRKGLFGIFVLIISLCTIFYLYPFIHVSISPRSPHLATSNETPSMHIKKASSESACPVTVVTALYDIGRGDTAHKQDKTQSWNNYLNYFLHVLKVNSCLQIHVAEPTVNFILKHRQCNLVGREKVRINTQNMYNATIPPDHMLEYERLLLTDCKYPTEILVASLSDLRAYKYYDTIQDVLNRNYTKLVRRPNRPEKK